MISVLFSALTGFQSPIAACKIHFLLTIWKSNMFYNICIKHVWYVHPGYFYTWTKNNQFGEDRCTQFRVIVVTDPQTNTPTNTQTNLLHTHAHKPTDSTDYNTLRRSYS